MKIAKWCVLIGLVGILSISLAACGGKPKDSGTILIGGALCLTGIQAPLDEPAVRGAQLAVDELNKKGGVLGKKLEFTNLDGKSDPVTVGNVAVELIKKGAKAIIAPSDFDFGGPASREAQKAGIVGISPAASSPLYGSKTLGDKQFTMSMWNTTMGAATAEYAFNQKGWKVGYVVTDTFIDYTKSLSRYFIQHFKKLGGQIIFEDTYVQGAQDFSAQLARLKATGKSAQFIFISSYIPDLGTIIRTIREAGITVPVVGGDSYDDPGLFKALGEKYGSDIYFDTHSFLSPGSHPGDGGLPDRLQGKVQRGPGRRVGCHGMGRGDDPGAGHAEGGLHGRGRHGQGHGDHGFQPADRQAEVVRAGQGSRARHRGAAGAAGQGRAQVHRMGPAHGHPRAIVEWGGAPLLPNA